MRLTFACYLEVSITKTLPGAAKSLEKCCSGIDVAAFVRRIFLGEFETDQPAAEGELFHAARRLAEEVSDAERPGWREYGTIVVDCIPNREIGPMEGVCESQNPAVVCPKCSKPMIRRSGGRGPFWGCTTYPGCKGTRPISK